MTAAETTIALRLETRSRTQPKMNEIGSIVEHCVTSGTASLLTLGNSDAIIFKSQESDGDENDKGWINMGTLPYNFKHEISNPISLNSNIFIVATSFDPQL